MPKVRNTLAGIGISGTLAVALLASGSVAPGAAASGGAAALKDGSAHLVGTDHVASLGRSRELLAGNAAAGALGQRMALSATASDQIDTLYSTNWSGAPGTGTHIMGARGAWTVPTVSQSTSPRYSSTWVGVDGIGNRSLIQTGTEQDTNSVGPDPYFAWIEILPHQAIKVFNPKTHRIAVVRPGDKIAARVFKLRGDVWTISIRDKTRGWYFTKNYVYHGPKTSAEWIVEAPTIDGVQSHVDKFGHVTITSTGVYVNQGAGLAWYSTALEGSNRITMKQEGIVKATVSVPLPKGGSRVGQHFTVTYKP